MRNKLAAALLMLLSCATAAAQELAPVPVGGPSVEQQKAWQEFASLYIRTGLGRTRGASYELSFDFTLNDLEGKQFESGRVDASRDLQGHSHWHIHAPSLDLDSDAPPADYQAKFGRESFLVNQMLNLFTRPVVDGSKQEIFSLEKSQREVDGVTLSCESPHSDGHPGSADTMTYCMDQFGRMVVVQSIAGLMARRTDFKPYGAWQVPQRISVAYGPSVAITAHLTSLRALNDPGAPTQVPAASSVQKIPAAAMEGMITKKKNPKYPYAARLRRIEGTVILCGIIDERGRFARLEPVASPDPSLTQSTLEAVRKWEYKPSVINGKPTAVETTITAKFALNR